MKPTVVTLAPRKEGDTLEVATFEEAFGAHSELRGRGRARRQKRKMERKKNRQVRKMTRINNRAERKNARQTMRASQQEARQQRKDVRKTRKVARKAMGDEADVAEEEVPQEEVQDTTSYEEQAPDTSYQEEPQYEEYSEEEAPTDEYQDDSETGYTEEEEPSEEEYGFDGNYGAEDYYMNVDGEKKPIHPKLKDIAKRLERNKERITQLEMRLQSSQSPIERQNVSAELAKRRARIKELDGLLEGYSGAKGRGKAEANRRKEVRAAKKVARQERRAVSRGGAASTSGRGGGVETEVESSLDPTITEDRIDVPPSDEASGFNGGTGFIGVDDQNDFDAPATRKFDLNFSSADGTTKSKINVKALAIGVGVGLVAIYLMNKYKVFAKK